MADPATPYQRGLEGKPTLESDKAGATTKAPAERLAVLRAGAWMAGCRELSHDPDLCLTFLKHSSISQGDLAGINTAMSYLQQAPTGNALLAELRTKNELMVGIHFFAKSTDYPWQSEVTPAESGHARLLGSAASPVVLFHVSVFVAGRRPECIADTLFHELLHVLFMGKFSGYTESLGTGHDASATITIDPDCRKSYAGFDPRFQEALEGFDRELAGKIPGAKKCCS